MVVFKQLAQCLTNGPRGAGTKANLQLCDDGLVTEAEPNVYALALLDGPDTMNVLQPPAELV